MKFGKEFSSQMVQEWQGAYMDYTHLKNQLKTVIRSRQQDSGLLRPKPSLRRAFSGLIGRNSLKEEEVAMIPENQYQTFITKLTEEGAELELQFFKKLDHEFDKVRVFHESKVEGMKENAELLSKQMDALIALRIKVEKQRTHLVEPTTAGVASVASTPSPITVADQGD